MNTRFTRYFSLAIIIIFQYLLAIISVILFPGLGISFLKLSPPNNFYLAHLSLLAAFMLGIFLAGWLGLVIVRRQVKRQLLKRLLLTAVAVAIPLGIALIPGIDFDDILLFLSILCGILGFYLPEIFK